MEIATDSIPKLFNKLSDAYFADTDPKNLIALPSFKKHDFKARLKRNIFNTLFQNLKGPHRPHTNAARGKDTYSEEEIIYMYSYDLRCRRKFDEANRLEGLVEAFKKDYPVDLRNCFLRFLLCLSNSVTDDEEDKFVPKVPVLYPDKSMPLILPNGPSCYGDTAIVAHNSSGFMTYPTNVFEINGLPEYNNCDASLQNIELESKIFEMAPGTRLLGNGLFAPSPVVPDTFEGNSRHTLFGALIHSKTSELDVVLDIPDIQEDCAGIDIRIPKMLESMEDEGFVDAMSVSSSGVANAAPNLFSVKEDKDIWEVALTTERQKHYTWEHIGVIPQPKEKPYVTEAGDQLFDAFYKMLNENLQTLDPSLQLPQTTYISMKSLVKDSLNLLIGVPSDSFRLDKDKEEFIILDGLALPGVSPEGLQTMCQDFLEAGLSYYHLTEFSKPPNVDSFYKAGLIYQAFTGAIRKYLQYYRGCVLSIMEEKDKSIVQIKNILWKTIEQIRYLDKLCKCQKRDNEDFDEEFPTGVHLLSYIYKEALELTSTHLYPLVLSLLKTSCGPYVLFIQEWVFHGVCRDIYGEFMVQVREDYLRFRNKMYWTHGYLMITKNVIDSVPLFLLGMANDIFVCGKSINLLRLCNPQHFLFAMETEVPRMMITFSEEDLVSIDKRCQGYLSRMNEIARQKSRSRKDQIRRAEQAKQDLVILARQAANKELERLKDKISAVQEADNKKKRKLFSELKQQMEKDLRRRAAEKEEEMEEDKKRMVEAVRQEVLETRVEEELEARAREELVEYYEKLSEEATLREQRALWRVRRRQLDIERIQFLQDEEAALIEELEKSSPQSSDEPKVPAVNDPSDAEFNQWSGEGNSVDKGVTDESSLVISGTADESTRASPETLNTAVLPGWAEKGLQKPMELFGINADVTESLPNWAKQNTSYEPVKVGDENPPQKPHPSQSTMGDVLRTQSHDPKRDWSDERTADELGYRHVEANDKPIKHHPSESTAGGLIYAEPESKEDRKRREANNSKEITNDGDPVSVEQPASPTESIQEPTLTESGEVKGNSEFFSEKEVENMVLRKTGEKKWKNIGTLPVAISPQKTSVKLVEHQNKYKGEEPAVKPSIRVSKRHVSEESGATPEVKSNIKTTSGMSATTETGETYETKKPHVRMVSGMSSSQQSKSEHEPRMHLKSVGNMHSSMESKPSTVKPQLRFNAAFHASRESAPELPRPLKRSMFGHISQLSRYEFDPIQAPKLGVIPGYHASMESEPDSKFSRDFLVKASRRKKIEGQSADKQSEETDGGKFRPGIKMNQERGAWTESEYIDTDAARLDRFKQRNVHGHSSKSTVENILYGTGYGSGREEVEEESFVQLEKSEIDVWMDDDLDEYESDFRHLNNPPTVDLLANLAHDTFTGFGDYGINAMDDISAHEFVPLSSLLKRSITAPLLAQVSVVNQSVVNYFMAELEVEKHLIAIKRFLLMDDGEFSQSLSDQLFEKLATNPTSADMLNPMYLNNVLSKAFRSSNHGESQHAKNISFALKFRPKTVSQNALEAFDCLQLTYKVDWPLNIIITEGSMATYSRVFSFKLQLRRVVWVLIDIWHNLKRDAIVHRASNGYQFRRLQLCRHEMEHFVKVLREYMSNQIIHVSWKEFQDSLTNQVQNLDDLHEVHRVYLNKCLSRCLLNKKAVTVMKIIQDIFGLILKFRMQLISSSWERDPSSGEVTHPMFEKLCGTYKSFKDYSKFLFTVVNKLAMRGYQPHLQELVLRLNYNHYYKGGSA